MESFQSCECENCIQHRKQPSVQIEKRKSDFYGIQEGDPIKVFSNGIYMGTGIFLRIEHTMIIWIDKKGNRNITNQTGSTLRKITVLPTILK